MQWNNRYFELILDASIAALRNWLPPWFTDTSTLTYALTMGVGLVMAARRFVDAAGEFFSPCM